MNSDPLTVRSSNSSVGRGNTSSPLSQENRRSTTLAVSPSKYPCCLSKVTVNSPREPLYTALVMFCGVEIPPLT